MSAGGWFEQLFGFKEEAPDNYGVTQAKLKYDGVSLTSKDKPDRKYTAGMFETPSVAELRAKVNLETARSSLGGTGTCTIQEIVDDVSAVHIRPENKGATFQAASQFNCLEHTSEEGLPEHGITCYSFDRTQGPACAISCAPGTAVRNYKVKLHKNDTGEGQSKNRQLQNLADIEKVIKNGEPTRFFRVVSGYTMADNGSLKALNDVLAKPGIEEEVIAKLRIGVQQDTEVTCYAFGQKMHDAPDQLVTQAYCSAISVSYSRARVDLWKPFARLILQGAYEASFYAAVEAALRHPDWPGSRKLYLTALGGGVFGNELQWIADAIDKAMEKFQHVPLEVYIVSFRDPIKEFQPLLRKWQASNRPVPGEGLAKGNANSSPAPAGSNDRQQPPPFWQRCFGRGR
mmetsp:Transcript_23352/g.42926  ORF Transcript_23352/g.42926 Transcript_23352/m.42926 type:complete len:401 (+) Transcript_23352:46-1248(+)